MKEDLSNNISIANSVHLGGEYAAYNFVVECNAALRRLEIIQ